MTTPIGRKRYHAWSDTLTLGFAILTDRWSGFVPNPDGGCVAELFDLCDFDGEIVARSLGRPSATVLYGTDINFHVTSKAAWVPADTANYVAPAGLVGRRLVTTWTDTTMLSIDKIVGSPSRFGISEKRGDCAMIYDIVEVMGETVEVLLGRPQTEGYGQDANSLVADGFLRGTSTWLAVGESPDFDRYSGPPVDPKPVHGPRV